MTGHSVAFSVSLVRLGKRGEAEVHRARREEVFVRPKKGQDEANFESEESLSIVTETGTGDGGGSAKRPSFITVSYPRNGIGSYNSESRAF
jgi:hypothetical protein